jgi:N,N-dimethylformamidase
MSNSQTNPIAFVSDEQYVALSDVLTEWESVETELSYTLRSTPRGAIFGDLPAGSYRVYIAKDGFGAKTSFVEVGGEPAMLRLLSNDVVGYMWPKWSRSGEQSQFRVHATEPFQLTLWRYGLKKEYTQMIGWIDEHGPQANRQMLPDSDFTQTGCRWNSEGFPSPPVITAPERSGLYYLWAKTLSGKTFSFPWVVAPSKPSARIAVLASTNTWNAYNNVGGRSNYINPNGLPSKPIVYGRQDLDRYYDPSPFGTWRHKDHEFKPLSFDRPDRGTHIFDNPEINESVQGRVQCGLAPAEWRLFGWLEREGFAYDLYGEGHLHEGKLPLDAYSTLIISVHPEYWTREMYTSVKDWVYRRGGKLIYLGGNGLDCEVTINEQHQMHCLSHVNSINGELGGHSEDGKFEYDSRLHRTLESQANLLGVHTTVAGIMTSSPFRVTDASHWVYEGTDLKDGDLFGFETLHERIPGGASGHETDKRSPSSPENTLLLAKGTNIDLGGSEMVFYDREGGGAVFSVGSITWVAALFTDAAVSTITRNVVNRFARTES